MTRKSEHWNAKDKAWNLLESGRVDEAVEQAKKNYLDYPDEHSVGDLGQILFQAGRFESAKEYLDKWAEIKNSSQANRFFRVALPVGC